MWLCSFNIRHESFRRENIKAKENENKNQSEAKKRRRTVKQNIMCMHFVPVVMCMWPSMEVPSVYDLSCMHACEPVHNT